jgi:drug/metabolite transporter (DMT)-like permease
LWYRPAMGYPISPELLVLVAAAIWGTSGVAIHYADLPSGVIAFFRMAVPTVVLGGWFLLRRHRLSREGLALKLGASTINAVRMFFFFTAYRLTSVANAVVSLYTWPIFAAVFARMILGEKVTGKRALLLLVAFLGIPFLYLPALLKRDSAGLQDLLGISSMLVSAALHGMAIVLLKRARPGKSRFESTFFQNVVGAFVFLPVLILSEVPISPFQIGVGLYLGFFVGVVGFTLFFVGLHTASAARVGNLAYFEVIVAVVLSVLILREPLYWNTVVGGGLIVVSVLLSQRYGQRTKTHSDSVERSGA